MNTHVRDNLSYLDAPEIAYVLTASLGPTAVTTTGSGDLFSTLSTGTFDAVKHYFEVTVANLEATTGSPGGIISFALYESTTPITTFYGFAAQTIGAGTGLPATMRVPFTPSAASHTYLLRWKASNANTWSATETVARVVRA